MDGSFDRFAHLRQPASDLCWWCGSKPATTGEHKFKRSDMARLMEGSPSLVWGYQGSGVTRELRGQGALKRDRYKVLKFPKSLCDTCNNSTSQPFDYAYDQFSSYLGSHNLRWCLVSRSERSTDLHGPVHPWHLPGTTPSTLGVAWCALESPFRDLWSTS